MKKVFTIHLSGHWRELHLKIIRFLKQNQINYFLIDISLWVDIEHLNFVLLIFGDHFCKDTTHRSLREGIEIMESYYIIKS